MVVWNRVYHGVIVMRESKISASKVGQKLSLSSCFPGPDVSCPTAIIKHCDCLKRDSLELICAVRPCRGRQSSPIADEVLNPCQLTTVRKLCQLSQSGSHDTVREESQRISGKADE